MNLRPKVRKHIFPDRHFVSNNKFCQKAFISVCCPINSQKKKAPISDTSTASQTAHELALKRLKTILAPHDEHPVNDDIECDDESSIVSQSDFNSGEDSFHKSSSQD